MVTEKKTNIKFPKTKKILLIGISLVLLLTIALGLTALAENRKSREFDKYSEITFVSPTEALIFWKTKNDTLGYIKYSSKRWGSREIALQTSSEEDVVHVVFLENIPVEGIYIWRINEDDPFWIIPKTEFIKYDSNKEINE